VKKQAGYYIRSENYVLEKCLNCDFCDFNDVYDFNSLKEIIGITDGNMASHMKALEREKYISVIKSFKDRKPNTKYKATERGRSIFKKHLDGLEQLIRLQKK